MPAAITLAAEAVASPERGARTIDYQPAALNPRRPVRLHLWLMLPAILVLASISLYPFFWLIYMSLHEVQLAPNRPDVWVGFANFARLLTDKHQCRVGLAFARHHLGRVAIEGAAPARGFITPQHGERCDRRDKQIVQARRSAA